MTQTDLIASYTIIILAGFALIWWLLTHPQRVIIREVETAGPQTPIQKAKQA